MTERDRQILLAIARLQPTTYRDVMDYVGLWSSGTVFSHVRKLRRRGIVVTTGSRTLRLAKDIFVSEAGNTYWLVREVSDGTDTGEAATL